MGELASRVYAPASAGVPERYQSGETDVTGGISKAGGAVVRAVRAADAMLSQPTCFKCWRPEVAKRRGPKRAKVAAARKLACVLHREWVDGTEFRWGKEAEAAA